MIIRKPSDVVQLLIREHFHCCRGRTHLKEPSVMILGKRFHFSDNKIIL